MPKQDTRTQKVFVSLESVLHLQIEILRLKMSNADSEYIRGLIRAAEILGLGFNIA